MPNARLIQLRGSGAHDCENGDGQITSYIHNNLDNERYPPDNTHCAV